MKTNKLVLAALAATLLSMGAAFAGSGNNGGGNGRSANDNGSNGRGAIASELKWRNAAHASDQAFLNANSGSAVGKLATLSSAIELAAPLYAAAGVDPKAPLRDTTAIEADIDFLLSPFAALIGTVDTAQGNLDAGVPGAAGYDLLQDAVADAQAALDLAIALAGIEAKLAELEAELALPDSAEVQAQVEAGAVVGVGALSPDALDALWDMLDR